MLKATKLQTPSEQQLLDIYGRVCPQLLHCSAYITDIDKRAWVACKFRRVIWLWNLFKVRFTPRTQIINKRVVVFYSLSILDHSCAPTALIVFYGREAQLRTFEKCNRCSDWRQMHINYIPLSQPSCQRQKTLLERYYFQCNCAACSNVAQDALISGIKCSRRQCGGHTSTNGSGKLLYYYNITILDENIARCILCKHVNEDANAQLDSIKKLHETLIEYKCKL
jgi:hypothetical protein